MRIGKQSARLSAADRGRCYAAVQRKSIVLFIALCSAKALLNPTPLHARARERGFFDFPPSVCGRHMPIIYPGGGCVLPLKRNAPYLPLSGLYGVLLCLCVWCIAAVRCFFCRSPCLSFIGFVAAVSDLAHLTVQNIFSIY